MPCAFSSMPAPHWARPSRLRRPRSRNSPSAPRSTRPTLLLPPSARDAVIDFTHAPARRRGGGGLRRRRQPPGHTAPLAMTTPSVPSSPPSACIPIVFALNFSVGVNTLIYPQSRRNPCTLSSTSKSSRCTTDSRRTPERHRPPASRNSGRGPRTRLRCRRPRPRGYGRRPHHRGNRMHAIRGGDVVGDHNPSSTRMPANAWS